MNGQAHGASVKDAAASYARISIAFIPVLLGIRAYEIVAVATRHALPEGAILLSLRGLGADLLFSMALAAILSPLLLVGLWRPGVAQLLHRCLLLVVAMLAIALAQYFATTFVPLGADLYGYTWAEIQETGAASAGDIGLLRFLPFMAAGLAVWLLTGLGKGWRIPAPLVGAFFGLALLGLLSTLLLPARLSGFSSDGAYFLTVNKTAYLAAETAEYLSGSPVASAGTVVGDFPLAHLAAPEDVLGPLLNLPAGTPPNIVILVVEGLGSDFVGPGAHYGGFTPFLDSLAVSGLYWENFLSTSGRTFGALPAILGSLPYGQAGFMELQDRMPAHHTLVSLLGEAGYATSYFTGTNGHYDFIDVFMDRQKVQRFVDQSDFPASYARAPSGEGGFSWGYADEELFRRSLEILTPAPAQPRLDVYLTISSHEPFIPPRAPAYRAAFQRRLATRDGSPEEKSELARYSGVFETLLYVDDAIRYFVTEYRKRPDFERTLLIITGDHRLIPIPPRSRIDRYRVPFMIVSPMVRAPRRFASVSSHLDVTPSLLALLGRNYGLENPEQVHWLGTGIDTVSEFRNVHSLPLMRAKNSLDEYLDGTRFLSQGQLFELEPGMRLREESDEDAAREVAGKLEAYRRVDRQATSAVALLPTVRGNPEARAQAAREDSAFAALGLQALNPEQLFILAREKAMAGEYEYSRAILRPLLRSTPNQHDARTLLGRGYGWERRFEEARQVLREVTRRAPRYPDGWVARVEVELWAEQPRSALAQADSALAVIPGNSEILARRDRAMQAIAAGVGAGSAKDGN